MNLYEFIMSVLFHITTYFKDNKLVDLHKFQIYFYFVEKFYGKYINENI